MKNGDYNLIIAPEGYPGKRNRNRYCLEHHAVWWVNTGSVITSEQVIHHRNGNTKDNRFENLELKSRRQHSSQHSGQRGLQRVMLICPVCNLEFTRRRGNTHLVKPDQLNTYCSKQCFYDAVKQGISNIPNNTKVVKEFKEFNKAKSK